MKLPTRPTGAARACCVRRAASAAAVSCLLVLAGCASVPNPNPRDPWEPMNREVSKFNEGVDAVVLKPVATMYREKVPPLMRTGVSNFFGNLTDAWSAFNSLLQLNVPNAAEDIMRFGVNTFFGLGGLLDLASEVNIERHREDFGQTLGRWGVPAGPYVVLPLLGPSTLRDTFALPFDHYGNLVSKFDGNWQTGLDTLRIVDQRANLLRVTAVLEDAALDKYSFTRDAHLQRRRAEIYDRSIFLFDRKQPDGKPSDGAEPQVEPLAPAESQPAAPAKR
ncbi:MAG TPA: VacJ family lipoprotein [Ramlibacter sp.]|uniref:MlaA family lipoprotein n=1 Tax=Ramlibacter sp. TaxID=1917967 RepID=UPI002C27C0EC|nr:VacJ family lipoprotein [Ramlibacter sp.]HVZ44609.1 VacJ family lipoprotein [Ramlibacter sp.]